MARELEIISRIRKRAGKTSDLSVGIGDDAAVIAHDGATDLIACCDLSVEGVHFRLDWMTPRLAGRKALAVTLSDVAAMGGRARFAMVGIAVPPTRGELDATLADEVMQGIFAVAEANDVAVIGGDTSSSPSTLFIDTIALGICAKGRAVTRGGAMPGDRIYVTGSLGGSKLGLLLLERGHRLSEIKDGAADFESWIQEAIRRHLQPTPRLSYGEVLGERGLATAMIDISDGLSSDLSHILTESQCGAILSADLLPIADCVNRLSTDDATIQPHPLALHGGEEYELLFTAPAENEPDIMALAATLDLRVTHIGRITTGQGAGLEHQGRVEPVEPSGYEHAL